MTLSLTIENISGFICLVFGQNKTINCFWHETYLVKNQTFQLIDVSTSLTNPSCSISLFFLHTKFQSPPKVFQFKGPQWVFSSIIPYRITWPFLCWVDSLEAVNQLFSLSRPFPRKADTNYTLSMWFAALLCGLIMSFPCHVIMRQGEVWSHNPDIAIRFLLGYCQGRSVACINPKELFWG